MVLFQTLGLSYRPEHLLKHWAHNHMSEKILDSIAPVYIVRSFLASYDSNISPLLSRCKRNVVI